MASTINIYNKMPVPSQNQHAIQMVDLHGQYTKIKTLVDDAIAQVVNHTKFINGPEVTSFAEALKQYLGVKHVIPCANGTDALQLAIMALELKPGDEVITPTFTFVATVEAIAFMGLVPVLVDVDPNNFTIDVSKIADVITPRTKAIMPVHLFGQGAAMIQIMDIAKTYNLKIIEDAAQCLGADLIYPSGNSVKLGTIGDIGCTSFFPSKNLGCFGDGGACFTNNDDLALRLKQMANHGASKKYYHTQLGINSRLDTIQAAVLGVKLNYLDEYNRHRQQAAKHYNHFLANNIHIDTPSVVDYSTHVFHQYTIKVKGANRNELAQKLAENGVPTMVYYPQPIHKQKAYSSYICDGQIFPVAELLSQQVLSLPMHSELTFQEISYISELINQFTING